MFSKVNPLLNGPSSGRARAPQIAPEKPQINLLEIRREILLFYDRWTRTDSGGFLRYLRTVTGVLEDLDTVAHLPSIIPSARGSVWFSDEIEKRCVRNLTEKFSGSMKQLDEALRVHNVTKEAVNKYRIKLGTMHEPSEQLAEILAYLGSMELAMSQLIEVRGKIVDRIKSAYPPINFSKNFEELSLYLLIVAETAEEYIPYKASGEMIARRVSWVVPRTLDEVRKYDGRNLFQLQEIS